MTIWGVPPLINEAWFINPGLTLRMVVHTWMMVANGNNIIESWLLKMVVKTWLNMLWWMIKEWSMIWLMIWIVTPQIITSHLSWKMIFKPVLLKSPGLLLTGPLLKVAIVSKRIIKKKQILKNSKTNLPKNQSNNSKRNLTLQKKHWLSKQKKTNNKFEKTHIKTKKTRKTNT